MPGRRTYRRRPRTTRRSTRRPAYRRRRTTRRPFRRYGRGRRSRMSKPMGFPTNQVIKLRYCDWLQLDPDATNSIIYDLFYANSIHDPYVASGGHSPLLTDQWSNFYERYTVIGSKITIRPMATTNSTTGIVWGVITTQDSTPPASNATALQEQGLGKWTMQQSLANGNLSRLSIGYSPKKLFRLQSVKDNQYQLGAPFGENPFVKAYFLIWAANLQDGDNPGNLAFSITIDYLVLLSDPKMIAQSG